MGPSTASWAGVSFIAAMILRHGLKAELPTTRQMLMRVCQRAWLRRPPAGAADDPLWQNAPAPPQG